MIQAKVDGLIIAMGKPVEADAQLAAAKKAGIPVITTVAGTSPYTLFDIQVNDYQIGAQAALYLLSKIDYSGAILTERYENNVASRIRGKVLDVILSENTAVKVLGSHSMARTASWQEDVRSGMQALILRNQGKFQGIWASFDGQAYVIDDLLRAQGLKKGDVVLVSIDGGPESYRRIKAPDSLLTATVGIPFERIGRTAVEKMNEIVVKKIPKNQVVSGPYLWMDAVLVDGSNVDQMLK
jgi:simple sugar transport system substrate-binding protein/ribose transport system substrate-binding protein